MVGRTDRLRRDRSQARDAIWTLVIAAVALGLLIVAAPTARAQAPGEPHGDLPVPAVNTVCYACHVTRTWEEQRAVSTEICLQCHGETPGTDASLVPSPVIATPVNIHASTVTGTTRFAYAIKCTNCHAHGNSSGYGWQQITYVRDFVFLPSLQVTDFTVTPPLTLTKEIRSKVRYTNPFEFDYVNYPTNPSIRGICNVCHTQTSYHRNDSQELGHNAGTTCTDCHTHLTGFSPGGGKPAPPHDTEPFVANCDYCHVPGPGGGLDFQAAVPDAQCQQCHTPGGALKGSFPTAPNVVTHSAAASGTGKYGYAVTCVGCHNPMFQQTNLKGIRSTLADSVIPGSPVTFTARSGPESFADGPPFEENLCETCHTQTDHHRFDGSAPADNSPGGYLGHFDGQTCTGCHVHDRGFVARPHPQAKTNCSNCHLNRTTAQPDLQGIHNNDCGLCHVSGFQPATFSFLGPLGTWNRECSACHNPAVAQTGNLPTPTRGHRCVACHGEQRSTADRTGFHKKHTEAANCVVCHGFIPDVGTRIGSGNRAVCHLCHGTSEDGATLTDLHKKMVPEGTSCLECHGGARPPIDVYAGTPVGRSTVVCQICHANQSPSQFLSKSADLHKKHVGKAMDCGFCHADAQLQDDRDPMPPLDDSRRALVSRSGYNECAFCHADGKSGDVPKVHRKHVAGVWQWCYNCHEGNDPRPIGAAPPVTQPSQACALCHSGKQYRDSLPLEIHEKHADRAKCYACHQAMPQFFDWPRAWLAR